MKEGIIIKYINIILLFIPMAFLFHLYETTQYPKGAFLIPITVLFVIFAGFYSRNINLKVIIWGNIFSILLSLVLGTRFITPPNDSWFNPLGMTFTILCTGILIFIGILIVRFVSIGLMKKRRMNKIEFE